MNDCRIFGYYVIAYNNTAIPNLRSIDGSDDARTLADAHKQRHTNCMCVYCSAWNNLDPIS